MAPIPVWSGNLRLSLVLVPVRLVPATSGKFQPDKMPNEYARAVHELVQAKIEQRAPEVEIETAKGETPKVINIMDALKKSMEARGQAKVLDAVRRRRRQGACFSEIWRGDQSVPSQQALGGQSTKATIRGAGPNRDNHLIYKSNEGVAAFH